MAAAKEQDEIGWINFVEGRISQKWRAAQADHYLLKGSKRTAKKWTTELVNNLLALVHKQWKTRNAVVHERNEQGLKVKEGKELEEAITEQFLMGPEGLLPHDQHHLTRGRAAVENMSAAQKKTWLYGIEIARQVCELELDSEVTQMRDAMFSWLN